MLKLFLELWRQSFLTFILRIDCVESSGFGKCNLILCEKRLVVTIQQEQFFVLDIEKSKHLFSKSIYVKTVYTVGV